MLDSHWHGDACGSTAVYSYLASDGLGSVSAALNSSGSVTATALYGPYGTVRYSSGGMPGSLGYTGQHSDAPGGLLYYGARYYDPAAGQFTSADTVLDGLNRFAYVGDNPETATDPSGHHATDCEDGCMPDGPIPPGGEGYGTFPGPACDDVCAPGGVGEEAIYQEKGWQGVPDTTWFDDFNGANGEVRIGKNPDGTGQFEYKDGTIVKVDAAGEVTEWDGVPAAGVDDAYDVKVTQEQYLRDYREGEGRAPKPGTEPPTNDGGKGGSGGSGDGNGSGNTGGGSGGSPPDFVVTPGGDVIPVPSGADGPFPTGTNPAEPTGIKYTGGQGGNGLAPNVTGVRIMNPTEPGRGSPGYPTGYAVYFQETPTGFEQTVHPYEGARIRNPAGTYRDWWHIVIDLLGN